MSVRVRSWLSDPVAAGAVAGAVIGLAELARLGAARGSLVVSVLAICVGAGAVVGLVLAIALGLAGLLERRLTPTIGARSSSALAALVTAAPAMLVLRPLGRELFQGAYAATLPGARWAPLAVPVLGWLAVAVAISIGRRWRGEGQPLRRLSLTVALVAVAAMVGAGNRLLFRSGYPAIHLVGALSTLTLIAVALRIGAAGPPLGRWVRAAVLSVVAVGLVVTAAGALASSADRQAITRADDVRHLARIARAIVDVDGDGTAVILGGGDCDEGDAAVHAGARDVPGNGVDEDCDGADAEVRARTADPAHARSLAEWAARPEVVQARAQVRDYDLIVLSIDALRADELPAAAADRVAFPHLSALLDGARWFQHGFAPAAGTDVSLGTLVTGRWNPFQAIEITLFEALAASGRVTHAVLPSEVLRYAGETLLTRGLTGLDRVVTDGGQRDVGDRITSVTTTDRALAFLDQVGDQRFALWVHYFDVHEHAQLALPASMVAAVPGAPRTPVEAQYRALVRVVDEQIGRLMAELTARGRADRTIIALCSDHGESLGEDPRLPEHHGLVVYQALIHVPIAIRVPGWPAGVEAAPVSLVDLGPTLASLAGVTLPAADGVDLTPSLLAADIDGAPARVLVAHEQDQWAVVAWPWKLLVRPADNLTELYNLALDPDERDDRSRAEPERVKELRAAYGEFPEVPMDRTVAGRRWRERRAQPPPHRSPS